jgi:hypothetical protein
MADSNFSAKNWTLPFQPTGPGTQPPGWGTNLIIHFGGSSRSYDYLKSHWIWGVIDYDYLIRKNILDIRITQSENRWKKCKGLDLNSFHLKWIVQGLTGQPRRIKRKKSKSKLLGLLATKLGADQNILTKIRWALSPPIYFTYFFIRINKISKSPEGKV